MVSCSVSGCDRPLEARGWCASHYVRWKTTGDVQADKPLRQYSSSRGCKVKGCNRKHRRNGFCDLHSSRMVQAGDPGPVDAKIRKPGEIPRLLMVSLDNPPEECLYTLGHGSRTMVSYRGSVTPAARLLWRLANGDPGDLFVLHACNEGQNGCLNISHLYLGTHAQNMRDLANTGTRHSLTSDDVRDIRRRRAAGELLRTIAASYSVSLSAVQAAADRQTWAWVED